MSYVEEIDQLRAELAACRDANRAIHEQDAANVAKLAKIRALYYSEPIPSIPTSPRMGDVLAILDGDA